MIPSTQRGVLLPHFTEERLSNGSKAGHLLFGPAKIHTQKLQTSIGLWPAFPFSQLKQPENVQVLYLLTCSLSHCPIRLVPMISDCAFFETVLGSRHPHVDTELMPHQAWEGIDCLLCWMLARGLWAGLQIRDPCTRFSHPNTNQAWPSLASEIRWDWARSDGIAVDSSSPCLWCSAAGPSSLTARVLDVGMLTVQCVFMICSV